MFEYLVEHLSLSLITHGLSSLNEVKLLKTNTFVQDYANLSPLSGVPINRIPHIYIYTHIYPTNIFKQYM